MKLYNIRQPDEIVSFSEATLRGSASQGGLFMPQTLAPLPDIDRLLKLPLVPRSIAILNHLIGDEFSSRDIEAIVTKAFSFPVPLRHIEPNVFSLELFHGPTLAFKDFGARFMAQVLGKITAARGNTEKITILTATSGDTGAAVAHAFYEIPNIEVAILYPAGRISPLQEKLFCTLGKNVQTFRVQGTFDDCQAMVKSCFSDAKFAKHHHLTSANSINFSRILAQTCYYFEAVAALRAQLKNTSATPVICVPCGNFGNLTAGIIAQRLGLPVKKFIAATNANDVVPAYLGGQDYRTRESIATLANAMDVGAPNNWERIVHLYQKNDSWLRTDLGFGTMNDPEIKDTLKHLHSLGHISEPHSAIAYGILKQHLQPAPPAFPQFPDTPGIFLATAHPAKFKEIVEEELRIVLPLPPALAEVDAKPLLSATIPPDVATLKQNLLRHKKN